jgi:exopolyphosphatase/guanosine-5'-triphosphate,3'-diphosphate pyrophosphatase
MRLGIIDLGTNSVRFDVHSIGQKGQVHLLHREKLMIRLGQGVFLENKLDASAIHRTVQAFLSFRRTATLLHTEKVIAFGTSALREASDSDALVDLIRQKTQIDIRVISGAEEAQLIASGILANEPPHKGRYGLVDIGGGSTEISICRDQSILRANSFPLGAARLQQIFLKKDSDPKTIASFRRYVKSTLLPVLISQEWPQVPLIIGSSGTIRALERILKKTNSRENGINRRGLGKLIQVMSKMTRAQLMGLPGLEPKRVDIILSGAILLDECMKALGTKQLVTTNFSLRDGILDREIRLLSHRPGPENNFKLSDIMTKVDALGSDRNHYLHVMAMAEMIFDRTRRLHRLATSWKKYLMAAAILHDVGKSISPTHFENHSYYIVRNADFPAMEKWESELIAQLCLQHTGSTLSKKDLLFLKAKAERSAFGYLLGILRVATVLDRGYQLNVQIQKISLPQGRVQLWLAKKEASELEILKIEQKKKLFEKVFGRQLVIRQ